MSKLNPLDLPFLRSMIFKLRSNFDLSVNNSRPSKVNMKMNRKRRIEKLAMSIIVFASVDKSNSKFFQCYASLNILRSLNPRKAEIAISLLLLYGP